MPKPNRIFTTGGPTQVSSGLYIERRADRELLDHCRNGEYAFVLSSRQVGKSSLMNNVARQLKAQDGIESVIIDLQGMGAHLSADQWYQGMLTRIARRFRTEINVAGWWQAHAHLGHADRFRLFLQEELLGPRPERIVIFIDEIDTTLSLDFSDDFFLTLRAMYNARDEAPEFKRLSFVLIGVATPGDLISDHKRSPFNIGKQVALDDFTFDEARPLAEGFGLPDAESGLVLGWAMKWTNGHPFLTQQLCRAVADQDKNHWTESLLDDLVGATFFGAQAEQNIHLKAVRDLLTQRAPKGYEEAMLKTYREVWRNREVADEARSISKSHLKLAGIVQSNGSGALHIRNEIYRKTFDDRWVKEQLPSANWKSIAQAAFIAIFLLSVTLGSYAWEQRSRAVQRADELAKALDRERQALAEARAQKQEAAKQAQNAEEKRRDAERQKQIANDNAKRAGQQTALANRRTLEAVSARNEAERLSLEAVSARNEAEHLSYVANMNLAAREFEERNYTRGYELINSYLPAPGAKADYRDFLWYLLWKEGHHEKQTLKGHTDAVNTLVWSVDGKTLTSASRDGTIKFWDVTSGRESRTLRFSLSNQVWSSDGKTVAGVSGFETIKLIDVASGQELRAIRGNQDGKADKKMSKFEWIRSLAWSSDGKTLASGSEDGTIKLWDTASGRELRTFSGHSANVNSLAWSPDGKMIASVGGAFGKDDTSIKLWDAASGRELRTIKAGYIKSLAWGPDGKTLAYGDSDTIKIYDPASGEQLRTLRWSYHYVLSVIWSRDGKTIVSAFDDKTIKLWDAASGRELRTLRGHSTSVESLALSHDGKTLASGGGYYGKDYAIKLWDVENSSGARILKGHTDAVNSLAWSPDGKMIVSGAGAHLGPFGPDRDSSIKIWNAASGRELRALRGHKESVWSVAWSNDGRTIASGSQDRTIKLWDATDGRELRTLQGHSDAIFSVVWNPDGTTLASGGADDTIKIWDAASGRELRTIRVAKSVYSLVWSRDGKTLASGGYDAIHLWDVASGRELRAFFVGSTVFSMDWSRDGKTLASGGSDNGTIKLWDVASGRQLRILRGHTGPVKSLAWSLDGKTIASGSDDKTVKLWDVFSGRELVSLKLHTRPVLDVAWSSDGKTLASGSYDDTIILLSAATDDEVTVNAWDQRP